MSDPAFQPYKPRRLAFLGLRDVLGYRLKVYSIVHNDEPFDAERFEAILTETARSMPQPARHEGRPGVGFAILHQGRTASYLILCWWDQENELPMRIQVSDPNGWHEARGGESVCVWDLRVIWWEREAYVGTVLASESRSLDAYLAIVLNGFA